jgi:hypothetical protein
VCIAFESSVKKLDLNPETSFYYSTILVCALYSIKYGIYFDRWRIMPSCVTTKKFAASRKLCNGGNYSVINEMN